jgi:hypothetical protein
VRQADRTVVWQLANCDSISVFVYLASPRRAPMPHRFAQFSIALLVAAVIATQGFSPPPAYGQSQGRVRLRVFDVPPAQPDASSRGGLGTSEFPSRQMLQELDNVRVPGGWKDSSSDLRPACSRNPGPRAKDVRAALQRVVERRRAGPVEPEERRGDGRQWGQRLRSRVRTERCWSAGDVFQRAEWPTARNPLGGLERAQRVHGAARLAAK